MGNFLKNLSKILKENYWLNAVLNSYGLIFFSLDAVFASIILAVTFFSPAIGVCGLLAVVLVNAIAYRMGFITAEQLKTIAKPLIKSGYGEYLLRVAR